ICVNHPLAGRRISLFYFLCELDLLFRRQKGKPPDLSQVSVESIIGFIHERNLLARAKRSLLRKRGIFRCHVGVGARYLFRDKRLRPCQGKPAEKIISSMKLWTWKRQNLPLLSH